MKEKLVIGLIAYIIIVLVIYFIITMKKEKKNKESERVDNDENKNVIAKPKKKEIEKMIIYIEKNEVKRIIPTEKDFTYLLKDVSGSKEIREKNQEEYVNLTKYFNLKDKEDEDNGKN